MLVPPLTAAPGIRRADDRTQAAQQSLTWWIETKRYVTPTLKVKYLLPSLMNFLVISGGTGGNSICSAFDDVCYVLPVSDDGGSSSEIIRVLGGPSIGCYFSMLLFRLLTTLFKATYDQGLSVLSLLLQPPHLKMPFVVF